MEKWTNLLLVYPILSIFGMVWYGMVWGEKGESAWSWPILTSKTTLLHRSTNCLMHNCAPLWGLHKYVLLVTHMGVTTKVQQDPLCGLTAYGLLHLSVVMSVAKSDLLEPMYIPKDELFVAVLGAGQPTVLVTFQYVLVNYNLKRPYGSWLSLMHH